MVPSVQEAISRAGPRFIGVLEVLKNGHAGIGDSYFDDVREGIIASGLNPLGSRSFDQELVDDLKQIFLPIWYGYHGRDRGSWHPEDWSLARPVFLQAIRGIVDLSIVRVMCVSPGREGHDYVMPLTQRATPRGFETFTAFPHKSKWEARIAGLAKGLHGQNLIQIPNEFSGSDGKYFRQKARGCIKVFQSELRYADWSRWLDGSFVDVYSVSGTSV